MKTLKRAAGFVLGAVIIIGVIIGLARWQKDDPDGGAVAATGAAINGIADVTYRWVPKLLDGAGDLIGGILGSL